MQSMQFTHFDAQSEKNKPLAEDLQTALEHSELVDELIAVYPVVRLTRTTTERERILFDWQSEKQIPAGLLNRLLPVVHYFARAMLSEAFDPETDTPTNWAEDLQELGFLSADGRPAFIHLIERLRADVLPEIKKTIRRRQTAVDVFPAYDGSTTAVELRAVNASRYRYPDSADKYVPEITDVAAIATVRIALDSGTPSEFCFQTDKETLDHLIGTLMAAKKDLAALTAMADTLRFQKNE